MCWTSFTIVLTIHVKKIETDPKWLSVVRRVESNQRHLKEVSCSSEILQQILDPWRRTLESALATSWIRSWGCPWPKMKRKTICQNLWETWCKMKDLAGQGPFRSTFSFLRGEDWPSSILLKTMVERFGSIPKMGLTFQELREVWEYLPQTTKFWFSVMTSWTTPTSLSVAVLPYNLGWCKKLGNLQPSKKWWWIWDSLENWEKWFVILDQMCQMDRRQVLCLWRLVCLARLGLRHNIGPCLPRVRIRVPSGHMHVGKQTHTMKRVQMPLPLGSPTLAMVVSSLKIRSLSLTMSSLGLMKRKPDLWFQGRKCHWKLATNVW